MDGVLSSVELFTPFIQPVQHPAFEVAVCRIVLRWLTFQDKVSRLKLSASPAHDVRQMPQLLPVTRSAPEWLRRPRLTTNI